MRISDWSSDVCSSDLLDSAAGRSIFPATSTRFRHRTADMAKPATQLIKMVSTADTGYFYAAKKNPRNMTEKLEMRKYDPVARKHVVFKESQTKCDGDSPPPQIARAHV